MAIRVPDALNHDCRSPIDRLLLGVSGSASILAVPHYVATFRSLGVGQIVALMTPSATALLPARTLALVCDKVYDDDTGAGQHMSLARWAQQILVLPATANTVGYVAAGLSPNLLTTTVLAASRPITLAPAMNIAMWNSRPVGRNIATLRTDGHRVIEPIPGTAWEVATKAFVDTLVVPAPEDILSALVSDLEPAGHR